MAIKLITVCWNNKKYHPIDLYFDVLVFSFAEKGISDYTKGCYYAPISLKHIVGH